ncbi:MAG TPA: lipocalin family protein [Planctomycetota bacterium]|nr:lipocalin family protein [Planctomycetota bacterium]
MRDMPGARESKKPLLIALAALFFLACGGCGIGALLWSALRHKQTPSASAPTQQRKPVKDQRIELGYSEKAEKESNARRGDSPSRSFDREQNDAPPLAPNTLFPGGKFPAGYTLDATCRGFIKGAPLSLKFQPNGAFVVTGDVGLKNSNPRTNDSDGTYRIEGNTLSLKFNNGESRELAIKPFEVYKDPPLSVLIDGEIFELSK